MTENLPSLFNLNADYHRLMNLLEASEGELDEEGESALEAVLQGLTQKVDNCAFVIDRFESSKEFYKSQAAKFSLFSKACQAVIERIEERITAVCESREDLTVQGDSIEFYLRKNPPSVVILDEYMIEDAYKKTVVTQTVDKAKLKEDLRLGVQVEGATLYQGWSLRTRPTKKEKK